METILIITGILIVFVSLIAFRLSAKLTTTRKFMNEQLNLQRNEYEAKIKILLQEFEEKKSYDRKCPHCHKFIKKSWTGQSCYHCNNSLS